MAREEQIVFPITLQIPPGENNKINVLLSQLGKALAKGTELNQKVAEAVKSFTPEMQAKMSKVTFAQELSLGEEYGSIIARGSIDLNKQRREATKNVNASLENTFSRIKEADRIIKKANGVLLSSRIRESKLRTRAAAGENVGNLIRQNARLQDNLRARIQEAEESEATLEGVIRNAIVKLKRKNFDVTNLKKRLSKVKSEQRSRSNAQEIGDLQSQTATLEETRKQANLAQQKIEEQEVERISKVHQDLMEAVDRSAEIEKELKKAYATQRKLRTDTLAGKNVGNLQQITDQRVQDLERQLDAQSQLEEDFYIEFTKQLRGKKGEAFEPLKVKNLRYLKMFNKRSRTRQRDIEKELYNQEEESNKRVKIFDEMQAASLNNTLTSLESTTSVYEGLRDKLDKLRTKQQSQRKSGKATPQQLSNVNNEITQTESLINTTEAQLNNYLQQVIGGLTSTINNPVFAAARKRFASYTSKRRTKEVKRSSTDFHRSINELETIQKEQDIVRKSQQEQFDNDAEILVQYADDYLKEMKKYQRRFFKEQQEKVLHERRIQREYPSGQRVTDDPQIADLYDNIKKKITKSANNIRDWYIKYQKDLEDKIEDINSRIATGVSSGVDVSELEKSRDNLIKQRDQIAESEEQFYKDLEIGADLKLASDVETRARNTRQRTLNKERERKQKFNATVMAGASAAVGLFGQAGFPILNVGFATLSGGPVAGAVAAVATAVGEFVRAMQSFEDATQQSAEKLGFVTTNAKLANMALEATKAGLSSIAQIQKRMSDELATKFLMENFETITAWQRGYEATKIGGKTAGYSYLKNIFMNPKNLIPFYSIAKFGQMGYEGAVAGKKAYKDLSPENQLIESREALRKAQLHLMKPLTAIEADPYEVWKRIQTAAMDPTKIEEMKLAREGVEQLKKIVAKLEEQIRNESQDVNSLRGIRNKWNNWPFSFLFD